MELSLMTLMLTAIAPTVLAEQACIDGTCPPKVNSLLQIQGRSTDVELSTVESNASQVDTTTTTECLPPDCLILADEIHVSGTSTKYGSLGTYNWNGNDNNNGLDEKDISTFVDGGKLRPGTTLKFDLDCTDTTNCLKIFEYCQVNNKRGISIRFQRCGNIGENWVKGKNSIAVVLDDPTFPKSWIVPKQADRIDWEDMKRLELYSGDFNSKKTKGGAATNFTLKNVRLEILDVDDLETFLTNEIQCAEQRVFSADGSDFFDNLSSFDDLTGQECAAYDEQNMCSAGGCEWDDATTPSCTAPTEACPTGMTSFQDGGHSLCSSNSATDFAGVVAGWGDRLSLSPARVCTLGGPYNRSGVWNMFFGEDIPISECPASSACAPGADTQLTGNSINHGSPIAVTVTLDLGGNVWIVGAVDGSYLKMVKLTITSETTHSWMETRYDSGYSTTCASQSTFTEACFKGSNPGSDIYPVSLGCKAATTTTTTLAATAAVTASYVSSAGFCKSSATNGIPPHCKFGPNHKNGSGYGTLTACEAECTKMTSCRGYTAWKEPSSLHADGAWCCLHVPKADCILMDDVKADGSYSNNVMDNNQPTLGWPEHGPAYGSLSGLTHPGDTTQPLSDTGYNCYIKA